MKVACGKEKQLLNVLLKCEEEVGHSTNHRSGQVYWVNDSPGKGKPPMFFLKKLWHWLCADLCPSCGNGILQAKGSTGLTVITEIEECDTCRQRFHTRLEY